MKKIVEILNKNYSLRVDRIELTRDMGSVAYTVFANDQKYFLRVLKPTVFDTAIKAVDIHVFLLEHDFPVSTIIPSNENTFRVQDKAGTYVLYDYLEGSESNPEQDAEAIGGLIGRLHHVMKEYPCELVRRDKQYFIGRLIDILRKKQYPRVDEFIAYGEELWGNLNDLPRGFCHGDMYSDNILKTPEGKFFVLDFDTACKGFPVYDLALICNMTRYSEYDERNYDKSNRVLAQFMSEYSKYISLSQSEINAFHYLIALQHFTTQASIMEIFGYEYRDDSYFDNQLDWLYRWREQCKLPN